MGSATNRTSTPTSTRLRAALAAGLLVVVTGHACVSLGAGALPAYNVELRETSVSGISSGAAMAVQLDVAYSSFIKGAGIIAGPPYRCAGGSVFDALSSCMSATAPIAVDALVRQTQDSARRGEIDAVANLRRHRIWLFSGGRDSMVKPAVVDAVERYYRKLAAPGNVVHRRKADAEHAMPTLSFGNPCPARADPYVSDCDYDAAGRLLAWIYPGLKARASAPLRGVLFEFDQGDFIENPSAHDMAPTGWVFVPDDCAAQKPCRLHVALHGCLQYPAHRYLHDGRLVEFGSTFVEHAGYNEWADNNRIIVLYPQAARSAPLFLGILEIDRNPSGCWDWWGYDDAAYATRDGTQLRAIRKMIDRIATRG